MSRAVDVVSLIICCVRGLVLLSFLLIVSCNEGEMLKNKGELSDFANHSKLISARMCEIIPISTDSFRSGKQ